MKSSTSESKSRPKVAQNAKFPAGLGGKNGWTAFLIDSDAKLFMNYVRLMKSSGSEPGLSSRKSNSRTFTVIWGQQSSFKRKQKP